MDHLSRSGVNPDFLERKLSSPKQGFWIFGEAAKEKLTPGAIGDLYEKKGMPYCRRSHSLG